MENKDSVSKKDEEKTASDETKEVTKDESDALIRRHVYAAMGVGLIPFPLVDFAALTGVQVNLIRKIAAAYNIPFSKSTVKNILSSLLGSAVPAAVSPPLAASISKFVPVIGHIAGAVIMPIVSGASTYALGKVFVQHFAAGGTLLSFDPEKTKAYYAEMFKEGEKVAGTMSS